MALIITLIMLAVVTFMALTFLAISRRERGAVTTTTDTITAQQAADDALASAEAQIMANTLAATNPYNFGLLVSTNYINTNGFQTAAPVYGSPTNVNYYYAANGLPVSGPDFLQLLANLEYLPRAPVLISTNDPVQGRFYLDLNRNGYFETNGWVADAAGTHFEVGDPEWIGVLQHPDQPYGPNNPFVARYAFIAVPIGNALDLNAIYNDALAINTGTSMNGGVDEFMRNQGVGSWEINLAAFLADLNTNEWDSPTAPNPGYFYNEWNGSPNTGYGFEDALSLLSYRYDYNYNQSYNLASVHQLFGNPGDTAFENDNIDGYSDGPLQTGFPLPGDVQAPQPNDNPLLGWSGADNPNHFFDPQELFNTSETENGVTPPGFTDRLLAAGGTNGVPISTYNRYTYYRLLSQMGVDSAPEQDQINLNYSNAFAYFNNNGLVTNITVYPGAETNFMLWTPLQFFTIAADRMLRTYSQEWIRENPSNYVATYGMTTNISTAANPALYPTNMPVPFGISDIPVLVSNQFVYTPAVQRVLQLAANIYDATTNNATVTTPDYPSVFRPTFLVTNQYGYTNVYINGYQQIMPIPEPVDFTQSPLNAPTNVTDLAPAFGFGVFTNVNIYGVPWIIGAKKGFPNFNEFAMESAFQLTRKLQVTRPNTNDFNYNDYSFNQMFNLSLSNQLGVECWNSYSNYYQYPAGAPRTVAIYVDDNLSVTLANDESFSFMTNFLVTGSFQIPNTNYAVWPGYSTLIIPSPSFQIPLYLSVPVIPTSTYRFNGGSPYLTTNLYLPFETGVDINSNLYPQPHWGLATTNNLQVIMLDTTDPNDQQVIDYVQLQGPDSSRDLTSEIISNYDTTPYPLEPSPTNFWGTNFVSGVPSGPVGPVSQIQVLFGADTNLAQNPPPHAIWLGSVTDHQNEIDGFRAFFGLGGYYTGNPGEPEAVAEARMTNAMMVSLSPTATVVQHIDWQANDPLVHYMTNDLNWSGANQLNQTLDSLTNSQYDSLGRPNQRYMPWSISIQTPPGIDSNPYNLAFKDPLVRQSDDWDFPTYKLPTVGWLGRVHRGTPWQTVYLKAPDILHEIQVQTIDGSTTTNSPNMGTNTWVWWTGDTLGIINLEMNDLGLITNYSTNYFDAANMAPVQDRLLFDLFTTAFNDNATRGQLSVNVGASDPSNPQAGLAAWSALFSGVQVLSNNAADSAINPAISTYAQHNGSLENFTPFPINPAGPAGANAAVGEIVTGISQTRANANNTAWISSVQVLGSGVAAITNEIPATFANADGVGGAFEHVGDILAVPQLSVQSPFLNWNNSFSLPNGVTYQQANGISEEMYDWLPQQVMSLLRVSGTPRSPMRYVIYCYGQALKPAPNSVYTGSATLANGQSTFGMVTNYQVVAESAARALVNFGSVVTNAVTTNALDNWISVPVVTNNSALILQYNPLPPD
ncbi:MAG: hypothetical protein WBN22_01860 [Verrucomicrobiia bacterium]